MPLGKKDDSFVTNSKQGLFWQNSGKSESVSSAFTDCRSASGTTRRFWEKVFSLGGTMEEGWRHPAKPNWSQRWGHNEALQTCSCQDKRSRGRATHWLGPNHHQYYLGVTQPWFLALPISKISFLSPKFMEGLLDLPCDGIWCLDSVGVRNNSLELLKMPQM